MPYILFILIIFIILRPRKPANLKTIIKKQTTEDRLKMVELAKKFIEKDCVIYCYDNNGEILGVLKEVNNGAILVETKDSIQAINLDFVVRIREHPVNKNGKKKSCF